MALFFPSVTGIMAGSNRSGVLRDAGHSSGHSLSHSDIQTPTATPTTDRSEVLRDAGHPSGHSLSHSDIQTPTATPTTNRSEVPRTQAGRSIPKGTLGAVLTTCALYLITVWLVGASISRETLKASCATSWGHVMGPRHGATLLDHVMGPRHGATSCHVTDALKTHTHPPEGG